MASIKAFLQTFCSWWRGPDSAAFYRHDWIECCRDSDEMRRILDDLRRECSLR
jgi:hypothetical protein